MKKEYPEYWNEILSEYKSWRWSEYWLEVSLCFCDLAPVANDGSLDYFGETEKITDGAIESLLIYANEQGLEEIGAQIKAFRKDVEQTEKSYRRLLGLLVQYDDGSA